MRQLGRTVVNATTMLSLIAFCLTTLLLPSMLEIRRPGNRIHLELGNRIHHVYAERGLVHVYSVPATMPIGAQFYVNGPVNQWHGLGFWLTVEHFPGWHSVAIGVPLWFLLLATGVLPGRALIRRSRRPRIGHCANCGYDLRATPDQCPECGSIPSNPKS